MDVGLLVEVYMAMTRGQEPMQLGNSAKLGDTTNGPLAYPQPRKLVVLAPTDEEAQAHADYCKMLKRPVF